MRVRVGVRIKVRVRVRARIRLRVRVRLSRVESNGTLSKTGKQGCITDLCLLNNACLLNQGCISGLCLLNKACVFTDYDANNCSNPNPDPKQVKPEGVSRPTVVPLQLDGTDTPFYMLLKHGDDLHQVCACRRSVLIICTRCVHADPSCRPIMQTHHADPSAYTCDPSHNFRVCYI